MTKIINSWVGDLELQFDEAIATRVCIYNIVARSKAVFMFDNNRESLEKTHGSTKVNPIVYRGRYRFRIKTL